jgi:hypothetical protein
VHLSEALSLQQSHCEIQQNEIWATTLGAKCWRWQHQIECLSLKHFAKASAGECNWWFQKNMHILVLPSCLHNFEAFAHEKPESK